MKSATRSTPRATEPRAPCGDAAGGVPSRERGAFLDEQLYNELGDPICPACGSGDTAPIHQEPMWASNDEPDPSVKDPPWFRCLSCRHKWRTDR